MIMIIETTLKFSNEETARTAMDGWKYKSILETILNEMKQDFMQLQDTKTSSHWYGIIGEYLEEDNLKINLR